MKVHQKVFKIISVLLQYPELEWIKEISVMESEIEQLNNPIVSENVFNYMNDSERINNSYTERKVHPFFSVHKNITAFFDYIKATPFDQLCEKYVNTFDYHGVVTLHLTYNVFKDSRKRGEALIELQRLYKTIDMEKTSSELPDYLPLILEFLSIAKEEQSKQLLKLHEKSLQNLHDELVKAKSEYHFLIKAMNEVTIQQLQSEDVS